MVHGSFNTFRKELKAIGNDEVNTTYCRHDNLRKKRSAATLRAALEFHAGDVHCKVPDW